MKRNGILWAMLAGLLVLSMALVISCQTDDGGGGATAKELEKLEEDYPGITIEQTIVIAMYEEAKAEGALDEWNATIDAMNTADPSLKIPKGNPKNWSKAVWIRLYESEMGPEGPNQGGPGSSSLDESLYPGINAMRDQMISVYLTMGAAAWNASAPYYGLPASDPRAYPDSVWIEYYNSINSDDDE